MLPVETGFEIHEGFTAGLNKKLGFEWSGNIPRDWNEFATDRSCRGSQDLCAISCRLPFPLMYGVCGRSARSNAGTYIYSYG